jgi:hypothetical protein
MDLKLLFVLLLEWPEGIPNDSRLGYSAWFCPLIIDFLWWQDGQVALAWKREKFLL